MKGGLHDSQIRSDSCGYPSKHRGRRLKPGDKLPTVVEFCELYSVSKITVKRAIEQITEEGLITSRRGSAPTSRTRRGFPARCFSKARTTVPRLFVRASRGESDLGGLRFLDRQSAGRGCDPTGNGRRRLCYHIVRVREVDGQPIVIEYTYMPLELIPGLKKKDLYASIYSFIREQCGLKISSFHRTIRAVAATEEEAERLDTKPGSPCSNSTRLASWIAAPRLNILSRTT